MQDRSCYKDLSASSSTDSAYEAAYEEVTPSASPSSSHGAIACIHESTPATSQGLHSTARFSLHELFVPSSEKGGCQRAAKRTDQESAFSSATRLATCAPMTAPIQKRSRQLRAQLGPVIALACTFGEPLPPPPLPTPLPQSPPPQRSALADRVEPWYTAGSDAKVCSTEHEEQNTVEMLQKAEWLKTVERKQFFQGNDEPWKAAVQRHLLEIGPCCSASFMRHTPLPPSSHAV